MKKDLKYIIKRILIGVGIVLVMSFINSFQVNAETIDYLYSQPFGIRGNAGDPAGYVQLYNSGYGGATNNFKYGTYPFMILEQNLIQFNEINTTSGNFDYILQLSICQTTNDMSLNYDSGSVHSYVRDISTLGAIESGTCKINVYTGRNVNYYVHINAQKRMNENCNSNYCVIGQQFVLRWASNNYNEFRVLSQKYYEYTDEIANMLANAKSQTEINNKLQQQLDLQTQQMQQQHQDSINQQNAINSVNDSINDSSIPSDSSSKINNITDTIKANQNSSIVQIATFFPQTLQLILNGFNTSCTGGYSLGSLYGTELTIPCINPVDYLGSFLWGVIDSILCLCYLIPLCKFLVNKYNDLTSMKNLRWQ